MELKVKDLRQYLESKKIPTAGCREKSELVDLVLQHCCSDAFLRQQAENQRRLRELTRRKEAEEQWEQNRGRPNNDSSPDSSDCPHRPVHGRHNNASSSPETSSGPDDPDDLSLGDEVQVDRPEHPDDALGAAARTTQAAASWSHRTPVYEIVEDFTMNHDGEGRGDDGANDEGRDGEFTSGANFEIGVDVVGDAEAAGNIGAFNGSSRPTSNGSAPVAPPSYDEVMASSSSAAANPNRDEVVDLTQRPEAVGSPSNVQRSSPSSTPGVPRSSSTYSATSETVEHSDFNVPPPPTRTPQPPPPPPHLSAPADGASSDSQSSSPSRFAGRRRIRLEELERVEDIKELSPRQLKEILVTNFVAYKGCCERWELEDRVKRLWNEHRVNQEMLRQTHERDTEMSSSPNVRNEGAAASTSSPSHPGAAATTTSAATSSSAHPDVDSQLCKICWDAVIDCVLLECGHMVTCTDCGRRMSECPICRQYVVRAVHVFRA